MKTLNLFFGFLFCCLILLSSCSPQLNPNPTETPIVSIEQGYPVSTATQYTPGYPITVDRIIQTAFEAYPIAEEKAKQWNPEAKLFGIPATFAMEVNLGYPSIGSGWFFMFMVEGQPLEYYVMVDNGVVQGFTEAQPIIIEKRPFEYLPLPPLDQMKDSDEFLDIYRNNGGKDYLANNPDAVLNAQLYYLSTNSSPIWSLYDVSKGSGGSSLFDMNAFTGEPIK